MSCGNPHETDCGEAIDRLYEYLDGELTRDVKQKIAVHLQECGPCLVEADVERAIKTLVARTCSDQAPGGLRERILSRLDQARHSVSEA